MSPDLLPFMFLVTSTALVVGVAVTVRGLYGFVSDATPRLPAPTTSTDPGDANEAGSSTTPDASGTAPVTGPRDLREPLIMSIGGVFICVGALITLSTLVRSA
jgi:hypothetical protein